MIHHPSILWVSTILSIKSMFKRALIIWTRLFQWRMLRLDSFSVMYFLSLSPHILALHGGRICSQGCAQSLELSAEGWWWIPRPWSIEPDWYCLFHCRVSPLYSLSLCLVMVSKSTIQRHWTISTRRPISVIVKRWRIWALCIIMAMESIRHDLSSFLSLPRTIRRPSTTTPKLLKMEISRLCVTYCYAMCWLFHRLDSCIWLEKVVRKIQRPQRIFSNL